MGRRKSSAYYARKATEAEARETYYRTRPARARAGDAVVEKNMQTYIYRSLLLKWTETAGDTTSNDHLPFRVDVSAASITKVTNAANVGLLGAETTAINTSIARPIRGSGIKPSKAEWSTGRATPVVRRTAWNTAWLQYYDNAEGAPQSNFSVPLSVAAGGFSAEDIGALFKRVFGGANKATYLGEKNGRAELSLESVGGYNAITT